jgi:hypothetical protein
MDREVYSDFEVGQIINKHFISVKVQIDTSKSDDEAVGLWYKDASILSKQYEVSAFPTFLFFSPNGKIVHRYVGGLPIKEFISLAKNTLDSQKQYYTRIEKYKEGQLTYAEMPELAELARGFSQEALSLDIARNYMLGYLNNLDEKEFLERANLDFLSKFRDMITSKDKIFALYFKQPNEIDQIKQSKGHAKELVKYIIIKEEIQTLLNDAKIKIVEPSWNNISKKIEKKYGKQYADVIIAGAKVSWYQFSKDMPKAATYLVQRMKLEGIEHLRDDIGTMISLNNSAFFVFKYSSNKYELKTAIEWVNKAIKTSEVVESKPSPGIMDTKANLLYKIGKKKEAIQLEEKVIQLLPTENEFKKTLSKMKKDLPTWNE